MASPSRYFNVATLNGLARTVDLCYIGFSIAGELIDDPLRAALIVRQARGPECSGIAPNGPATPRVTRIPYDDPRSVFNGCRRNVTLGATRITNGGGSTIWYSDPYGRAARAGSFIGGVKQYVEVVNNSTAGDIDRVAFGADLDPCLLGQQYSRAELTTSLVYATAARSHVHSLRYGSRKARTAQTDQSAALRSGRALRRSSTTWHSPCPSRQARGT